LDRVEQELAKARDTPRDQDTTAPEHTNHVGHRDAQDFAYLTDHLSNSLIAGIERLIDRVKAYFLWVGSKLAQ
jgi:hypothetical protein